MRRLLALVALAVLLAGPGGPAGTGRRDRRSLDHQPLRTGARARLPGVRLRAPQRQGLCRQLPGPERRRRAVEGLRVVRRRLATALVDRARPGPGCQARRPGRQPDPRRPAGGARDLDVDGPDPQRRAPVAGAPSPGCPARHPTTPRGGPAAPSTSPTTRTDRLWKVSRKGRARPWFTSTALDGLAGFGTTGIVFRKATRDLLITQQTAPDGLGRGSPLPAADPARWAPRRAADAVDLAARRPARRLRDRDVRAHLCRAGRPPGAAGRARRRTASRWTGSPTCP